jgi:hypothetical protein
MASGQAGSWLSKLFSHTIVNRALLLKDRGFFSLPLGKIPTFNLDFAKTDC